MMRALNTSAGRITTMVVGACLAGGWINGDALAAKVFGEGTTEFVGGPTQMMVSLDYIGVNDMLHIPYYGHTAKTWTPQQCRFDPSTDQRICRGTRGTSAETFNATALSLRSRTGAAQHAVDWKSTDTIGARFAWVKHKEHPSGRTDALTFRSSFQYAGTSTASKVRVINGADTAFKSFEWRDTNRVVRNTTIRTYSNVTVPMTGDAWPTTGVIFTQTESVTLNDSNPAHARPRYYSTIVHFNGTQYPDFTADGKQYVLDLRTGIATLR
jgi:hypothetical protein